MSITAITGKPSGGKTLYAVSELIRLLVDDGRFIVTNISLIHDEIQRYLLSKGHDAVDCYSRVRLLSYEETRQFWRFRGGPKAVSLGNAPSYEKACVWASTLKERLSSDELIKAQAEVGIVLPEPPDNKNYGAEWLNVILEAASPLGGVIYFIDEMHEHLNARNWQRHGLVAADYAAIHAHMGDEVYWISQAPSLVDTQFRVRTQEYLYCENLAKEVILGKFNRAGQRQFRLTSYLEPFTGTQQPQWKKDVALDKQIAKCYKRSRFGGDGDTKEKRKGVHFYWLWVVFAVLVALAIVLSFWGPKWGMEYFFKKTMGEKGAAAVSPSPSPSPASGSGLFGSRVVIAEKPKYLIVRETFRGGCEPDLLITAESGHLSVGKMSPFGLIEAVDVPGRCCRVRTPDGVLLFLLAVERPNVVPSAAVVNPLTNGTAAVSGSASDSLPYGAVRGSADDTFKRQGPHYGTVVSNFETGWNDPRSVPSSQKTAKVR